jgi:hypothetical protein
MEHLQGFDTWEGEVGRKSDGFSMLYIERGI